MRESVSELTSEAEGGKTFTKGAGKGAFSISASLPATSTTINYSLLFLNARVTKVMGRGERVGGRRCETFLLGWLLVCRVWVVVIFF